MVLGGVGGEEVAGCCVGAVGAFGGVGVGVGEGSGDHADGVGGVGGGCCGVGGGWGCGFS